MTLTILAGCSATDPLGAWRQRVSRCVIEEGYGDPAVLRDTWRWRSPRVLRPGQPLVGHLASAADPLGLTHGGQDVQGVLIDTVRVDNEPRLFFLVGVVLAGADPPAEPVDIRLVAMSALQDRVLWRTGPANPRSLRAYLHERRRVVERGGLQTSGRGFPSDADHFRLKISGNVAVATDARSKASWTLNLAD